jgi:alkylated DNA repair dioxygenase AlkB
MSAAKLFPDLLDIALDLPDAPLLYLRSNLSADEAGRCFDELRRSRIGWHSDDEAQLGPQPLIASLSLGSPRLFQMKHRRRPELGIRCIGEAD